MQTTPTIAVNLSYLIPGEVGGSETVIRNVLPALTELRRDWQFVLITTSANHDSFADDINVRRHRVGIDPKGKIRRITWEQLSLPRLLGRLGADLLFSPAYYGPLRWRGHHVVFVHDMNYERHPEDFGGLHRAALRWLIPATCRRADRILTNSHFSKSEIVSFHPGHAAKIEIAHFGADHVSGSSTTSGRAAKPYLLCVARWYPHKNLPLLIRAFLRSGLAKEFQLVMVGGGAGALESCIAEVSKAGLQEAVIFRSGLKKAELMGLIEHCRLLVSPSRYEGFGLPLLEAMRLRAPILCTDLPVHREITDDHAHFFTSDDESQLVSRLRELTADEQKRMAHVEAAYQYAMQQTWAKTARVFAEVFESALKSG